LKTDTELAQLLLFCDKDLEYFGSLEKAVQQELLLYSREIVKYGGITHEISGGRVFTDDTLLKPARMLLKSLKKKKD